MVVKHHVVFIPKRIFPFLFFVLKGTNEPHKLCGYKNFTWLAPTHTLRLSFVKDDFNDGVMESQFGENDLQGGPLPVISGVIFSPINGRK